MKCNFELPASNGCQLHPRQTCSIVGQQPIVEPETLEGTVAVSFSRDVAVIGGCGHVGLPLALTFADSGLRTVIYDINLRAVDEVRAGRMPFHEDGAEKMLGRVLLRETLELTTRPDPLSQCRYIVLIVGTPVDEHLNPTFSGIIKVLDACLTYAKGKR